MTGPISMVGLIVVAVVLLGGTFALLMLGRPVPDAVWAAWGVVITALFGHGAFLAQVASHAAVVGDLMDAVNTGARAATTTSAGSITNGPANTALTTAKAEGKP